MIGKTYLRSPVRRQNGLISSKETIQVVLLYACAIYKIDLNKLKHCKKFTFIHDYVNIIIRENFQKRGLKQLKPNVYLHKKSIGTGQLPPTGAIPEWDLPIFSHPFLPKHGHGVASNRF